MRAIPSPHESTTPVSRTSSCFSNSLICSRMMSLISAARICIVVPPAAGLRAPFGDLPAAAQELGANAAVVDRGAGGEHHAAEQLGIDLRREEDLAPAREPPREGDELAALARRERHGRAHEHPGAPELVVDERVVRPGDLVDEAQ